MRIAILALAVPLALAACTTTTPCESIADVMEQQRRCDQMRRNMDNLKDNLQLYGAAKERYRQECLEFRYYRDDFSEEELQCLDKAKQAARQEARREQD